MAKTDDIKFTEEELNSLGELQNSYARISRASRSKTSASQY